jgi:PAS domain S-box-containing protein
VGRTGQLVNDEVVQLLDLSLDAFCIAGFDGYLRFANPAFARMLGYTQEELLARPFMDNVHPDDVESVGAVLGRLADGKNTAGSSVATSAPTARYAGSSGPRGPDRTKVSCTGW